MDAVLPPNLLAFGIGAAGITDADLVNSAAKLGNLGRNLGLETKAILFESDTLDDLPSKDFVASLHIREIEIAEHIRKRRQYAVAQRMPVVQHATGFTAGEARPEDNIRSAPKYRIHELWIFIRIVFQIGVLDYDQIAGGGLDSGPQSGAFSPVHVVIENLGYTAGTSNSVDELFSGAIE
jgi:hypothetical protein